MKKYLPIRIHNIFYGYGWWWGNYFFFLGKSCVQFGIVPMSRECTNSIYMRNGQRIGNGFTQSWHESRQHQAMEE